MSKNWRSAQLSAILRVDEKRKRNSIGTSDKYFLAHDLDEASEMFEYACTKRKLDAHVTRVEKWNRWKSTWEKLDVPSEESMRN